MHNGINAPEVVAIGFPVGVAEVGDLDVFNFVAGSDVFNCVADSADGGDVEEREVVAVPKDGEDLAGDFSGGSCEEDFAFGHGEIP